MNDSEKPPIRSLQRGIIAMQSKNLAEAVEWFRKAVNENPRDAQAEACLGQSLFWLGLRDEGLGHLRRSGGLLLKKARKTRDVAQTLMLVEQLHHWDDYLGALDIARQAVQIDGTVVRGFQLLALTYSRLNQGQAALAAGRQALRLAPDSAMLAILVATLEAAEKQREPARRRLEKVLARPLAPVEAFRAHKELAMILDKLGEYGEVFAHLHASAKLAGLLPEVKSQDAALVPNMLKTNQAEFEPTFRRIFDFLGLSWDPQVADFHQRAAGKYIASPSFSQVAQPLYASSVGRWRHYAAEFGEVAELLRPCMAAYGYGG